jgi:hypothetical protein
MLGYFNKNTAQQPKNQGLILPPIFECSEGDSRPLDFSNIVMRDSIANKLDD